MARITVVRQDDAGDADVAGKEPFVSLLLWDLDRVQSLREHTINPPGQERNIKPIDRDALAAALTELGSADGAARAVALLTATVYAGTGDVSLATIKTAADADAGITGTTDDEAEVLQDLLSVKFIETGNFKLSFDGGVLAKAIELGWVKVFTDLGDALYSL